MEDVRLERAPFFPFPSDHSICSFTRDRLLDEIRPDRKPPVRSGAYFLERKLALSEYVNT